MADENIDVRMSLTLCCALLLTSAHLYARSPLFRPCLQRGNDGRLVHFQTSTTTLRYTHTSRMVHKLRIKLLSRPSSESPVGRKGQESSDGLGSVKAMRQMMDLQML